MPVYPRCEVRPVRGEGLPLHLTVHLHPAVTDRALGIGERQDTGTGERARQPVHWGPGRRPVLRAGGIEPPGSRSPSRDPPPA